MAPPPAKCEKSSKNCMFGTNVRKVPTQAVSPWSPQGLSRKYSDKPSLISSRSDKPSLTSSRSPFHIIPSHYNVPFPSESLGKVPNAHNYPVKWPGMWRGMQSDKPSLTSSRSPFRIIPSHYNVSFPSQSLGKVPNAHNYPVKWPGMCRRRFTCKTCLTRFWSL